jgi:hypothetical protein
MAVIEEAGENVERRASKGIPLAARIVAATWHESCTSFSSQPHSLLHRRIYN